MARCGARPSAPTGAPSTRPATTRASIIWDVAGDRRLGRPFRTNTLDETRETPPPFALSPDGRTLAVARVDGRVDLIDAETLRRTGGFEAFADRSALAIEYSPDGRRLAVAGAGGGVGLWDAGSGKRVGRLLRAPDGPERNNPHNVRALAFGRGGLLAAAGVGGAVRIWDLDGRKLVGRPLHLGLGVRGLAFSPDGSQLAIPFGARFRDEEPDGVDVRDPRSGERLARLRSDRQVRSVAFSPDGRLLAGGQVDGSILVWATDGWRRVGRPLTLGVGRGQADPGLAFSPDGRTLATSHDDGTVALWDVGRSSRSARRFRVCRTPGRRPASHPTAIACSRSPTPGARSAGRSIPRPGCSTRASSPATSRPSSGKRSCPSRTTSRSVPRADDLDRGAPVDRACTGPVPPCWSLRAVNRHRALPHRETRSEATTTRRPGMRAHTITTKTRVGGRGRARRTIVPGGILTLSLAVVLLAATASTASAERTLSHVVLPTTDAAGYRYRAGPARLPWGAARSAIRALTSAIGRSERRARCSGLHWRSGADPGMACAPKPSTPASASPATTPRPITAHRRSRPLTPGSSRAASSTSPSPPPAPGPGGHPEHRARGPDGNAHRQRGHHRDSAGPAAAALRLGTEGLRWQSGGRCCRRSSRSSPPTNNDSTVVVRGGVKKTVAQHGGRRTAHGDHDQGRVKAPEATQGLADGAHGQDQGSRRPMSSAKGTPPISRSSSAQGETGVLRPLSARDRHGGSLHKIRPEARSREARDERLLDQPRRTPA